MSTVYYPHTCIIIVYRSYTGLFLSRKSLKSPFFRSSNIIITCIHSNVSMTASKNSIRITIERYVLYLTLVSPTPLVVAYIYKVWMGTNEYMLVQISCSQSLALRTVCWQIWIHFVYRFPYSDHSMQLDHIGMLKLSIDGCLLQKLDLVIFSGSWFQSLHSHFHGACWQLPQPLVHCAKLTRPQMFCNPNLNTSQEDRKINA